MIRQATLVTIAMMMAGCQSAPSSLPEGCYRLPDGTALFRIDDGLGHFAGADPRQFRVTFRPGWRESQIEVYPGFSLHSIQPTAGDGERDTPSYLPVADQPLAAARFGVEWREGQPAILVPSDAGRFGTEQRFETVLPGKPC